MRPAAPVLALADERLRMLDANAHREGLLFHAHALPEQRLHRVACAVPDGEDDGVGQELIFFAAPDEFDALDVLAADNQSGQPCAETNLTAEADDFLADRADDVLEQVGADMRLGGIQDILRRAMVDERLQHRADERRFRAGCQLAVGKRARTALAELHVAFGVERTVFLHLPDGFGALIDCLAAFEQNRTSTGARKRQRGEQSGRTCADNDRRLCECGVRKRRRLRKCVGDSDVLSEARKHLLLVLHGDGGADDEVNIALVTRVNRLLEQRHGLQLGRRAAELFDNQRTERFVGIVKRKIQGIKAKHQEPPYIRWSRWTTPP